MGTRYLIDSNSVIYYLEGSLTPKGMSFMHTVVNEIPNISIITKIEILGFKMNEQDSLLTQEFVDSSNVIGLSDKVVNKTIELRQSHKIKLPDAIIAATAIVFGYKLITRNVSDFKKISGLEIVNVWEIS